MFRTKANSKQKRAKNSNVFQIGRISAFGARFLSNQTGKTAQKIGGRVWQFRCRVWASQQFKNQLNKAFFT